MFAVKPLQDKSVQMELCSLLETEYFPDSLAYFAVDLQEDRASVRNVIGICQFKTGDVGEILTLVPAKGFENDEAMIIMERAVMSFMWRSGSKSFEMKETAGPAEVLERSGLLKSSGVYTVDLDLFFDSPCSYSKKIKEQQ